MYKKIKLLLILITIIIISAGCSIEKGVDSNTEITVLEESDEVRKEESDRVKEAKEVIYNYFEAEKERNWEEIIKNSQVREDGYEEHPFDWYKNPYETIELKRIGWLIQMLAVLQANFF